MFKLLNRLFLAFLMLAALGGIMLSIVTLFIPSLVGIGAEKGVEELAHRPDFGMLQSDGATQPADSPLLLNITLRTPPLEQSDMLYLNVYSREKLLFEIDCLGSFTLPEEYSGATEISCPAYLAYNYDPSTTYTVFGIFERGDAGYVAGPVIIDADWRAYERSFVSFSWAMGLGIGAVYLLIMLPAAIIVFHAAFNMKHDGTARDEYSLASLINPLRAGRTLFQKFHAFLVSPYFWALEIAGTMILLAYLAVTAEIWKSWTAFFAFIFSGLMAFIIPSLWCIAWWYADFREREPLRMIATFFLWGMLAALMAIGINSISGVIFGLAGLAALSTFIVPPFVEELYKGSGLSLLSGHHEFDSVEDGIAFGFVIGMGFSFIENWLYFLSNPLGSDVLGWLSLFLLRSIVFSASHGFYTAMTGGVIGFLIERRSRAPALGILVGFPLAAFFHAMHNSGEAIISLLGGGGALLYCCFLVPLFDYGGFVILVLLFAWAVVRRRAAPPPAQGPDQ